MTPCSYCGRMVQNRNPRHMLGSTKIQCPSSWKPWEKHDPKAVQRGDYWIKFLPLPMYVYVAKHQFYGFQIIRPFPPFMTAPMHPKAWDEVAARIVHPDTHLVQDERQEPPNYR